MERVFCVEIAQMIDMNIRYLAFCIAHILFAHLRCLFLYFRVYRPVRFIDPGADLPWPVGGRPHHLKKKISVIFSRKIPTAPLGKFRPHLLENSDRTP
ncbi:hypothetical protein Hdeb2414_s0010g00330311 [Helianthus debilis subsp. tardiflorus]